ncbi:MAG: polyprenyl synthetase family protein [Clostridia bacterium]|nr:polyprenyl synthetase family protein [Clostridia bacterium]
MIKALLQDFLPIIEQRLEASLKHADTKFDSVYKAMEYSLLSGGKRLRPFILNEFYKACGKNDDGALNFAAALEMIHTYSLIHDDLPAMDNDDFRRGRPSCHKAFGEDIALLAGDGLLTLAFETAAKTEGISADKVLKAIIVLSTCAGNDGMIGGQVIDLVSEGTNPELSTVKEMYIKKTGALIAAAAEIGTILAGGTEKQVLAAKDYALNLGIAFQIQDDILDKIGDSALLGKPVGSDAKNEKSTYVSITGLEKAKSDVEEYTKKAVLALETFGKAGKNLKDLAEYLINRSF